MSLLLILSILSPLVPLLIGYKRPLPLLWFYPFTGLVFDVSISFMRRVLEISHKWPANLFMLLEFILLSIVYREQIIKNKKLFSLFVLAGSCLFVAHTITTSIMSFNMLGSSFFFFSYLVYGLVGLYTILKKQEVTFLERSWFFWLNVALIVYASGNFFIFLFRDYMIQVDQQLYLKLWNNIFLLLNIIKNILIAVALYHLKKQPAREPG